MYSDTVTLFCRYRKKTDDIWYPTVLHDVNLNIDKSAITAKYGTESKDNASLHIKYQMNESSIVIQDKKYLNPKEWEKQPEDRLSTCIAFKDGQSFDFFFVGEWEEIPVKDEVYTDGFYNYMNQNYDNVFAITSVAGPYKMIPHFEILAK